VIRILNLTNHSATPAQQQLGLVDIAEQREYICQLLSFAKIPDVDDIEQRCHKLVGLTLQLEFRAAHLGGATYLTPQLHHMLIANGVDVYYSYSKRQSSEYENQNGEIEKKSIFSFENFVIFRA